jgi:hypothetical protein
MTLHQWLDSWSTLLACQGLSCLIKFSFRILSPVLTSWILTIWQGVLNRPFKIPGIRVFVKSSCMLNVSIWQPFVTGGMSWHTVNHVQSYIYIYLSVYGCIHNLILKVFRSCTFLSLRLITTWTFTKWHRLFPYKASLQLFSFPLADSSLKIFTTTEPNYTCKIAMSLQMDTSISNMKPLDFNSHPSIKPTSYLSKMKTISCESWYIACIFWIFRFSLPSLLEWMLCNYKNTLHIIACIWWMKTNYRQ